MARKLGLNATQRMALIKNQASALLWYGKIETTEARAKEESDRETKEAAQKAKEQAEKQWFEASKSEIEAVPVMEIPKDDFINEPEMIFKVFGADAINQIQNFLAIHFFYRAQKHAVAFHTHHFSRGQI